MTTDFQVNRLDGLWEWYSACDELVVNARWCEIQALDSDDCRRLSIESWVARVHPDDRVTFSQGLAALVEGRAETREMDVRVRSGEAWIWVLHRAVARPVGDGEPLVVHGTLQDITSRKRQEAMLRENEQALGRVGRMAGVGGWQMDIAERRVSWSDETCRIHGHEPGYRPTLEESYAFFGPVARPIIVTAVERATAGGQSFDVEVPMVRVDGQRIMVRVIGSVERHEGRPVRLTGAIQDVTDHAMRRLSELGSSHRELERVNERLSLATESGGIGIWDFDVASGRFVWDEQMWTLYGLKPGDEDSIDGERWVGFVHPDDRERLRMHAREVICELDWSELTFRVVTAKGEERELYGTARAVRGSDGRALRLVGTNQDVTEERRVAREFARQHEILRVTLHSIGDGVITTDPAGHVLWMNPVAEAMVGWSDAEARGLPLDEVFHLVDEETREQVPDLVRTCLDEDRITGLAADKMLIARDGRQRWIEDSAAPIRNDTGEVFGAVVVFHDVTEQRSAANEMAWRATHDELTGLANRSSFEGALERLHDTLGGSDAEHALLFIDLDRFKIVNDTCGHAAGDLLLRQVGRLLARTVRAEDLLVRLGGDEFAIILEHCPLERARAVAQEVCDLMDEFRFVHQGERFRIGASIGLVPLSAAWEDTASIVRAADTACYAAKESGRNRLHVWSETDRAMHARRAQTRWATRLETALDDDGFELYAQRIGTLDLLPEGFAGGDETRAADHHAEVLIRLRGDDGEAVLPGAFLPAAERFNLIDRIDQWVLGHVIDWLAEHRDRVDVGTLWINLSGQSFGDRKFQRDTLARLREAGGGICASLCLEITETAAVTNLGDAASFINELRALGVRIALDDFGAGASSFGYLKSLPVDYLKIDGQFVRELTEDALDAAAVRCFAEVARVMNVKTVAEFVETPAVLDRLRDIGIDFVQGWLLHEPAPIAELLRDDAPVVLAGTG